MRKGNFIDINHKIGNPVFAIETNLVPLIKRVKECNIDGSLEIINEIRISIEKIKTYLEQVKGENHE